MTLILLFLDDGRTALKRVLLAVPIAFVILILAVLTLTSILPQVIASPTLFLPTRVSKTLLSLLLAVLSFVILLLGALAERPVRFNVFGGVQAENPLDRLLGFAPALISDQLLVGS